MAEMDDIELAKLDLDERLTTFVETEMAELDCSSVREYLRGLIMSARAARIRRHIAQLIREGMDSGLAVPATAEYWSAMLPISAPRELLQMDDDHAVYCRPLVVQDIAALAGEIAPHDRDAAQRFICMVLRKIRGIGRKPASGISIAGFKSMDLMMRVVGRTVARIAYRLPRESPGVEILRVLHRDRDQVLVRHIDSSPD